VVTAAWTADYVVFLIYLWLRALKRLDELPENSVRLLAQVQLVDQFLIAIGFCFAQIIEQAPALRDHFKQAAARRMIFAVGLEVFGQMLDPAGEKCDLHICTASIFFMQLELLEAQRLRALCHLGAPIVSEERTLATTRRTSILQMRHRHVATGTSHWN
jgi:hypothetical protein